MLVNVVDVLVRLLDVLVALDVNLDVAVVQVVRENV